ncbi:hypothetical protein D9M70_510610 [compost metagenome]
MTIARSSLRLGRKIPGVSTSTICALFSMKMPRTSARVVCTLCVTMETFVPTSWLTSVDFPAFGAPISATKPERVCPVSVSPADGVVGLFIAYPFESALVLKETGAALSFVLRNSRRKPVPTFAGIALCNLDSRKRSSPKPLCQCDGPPLSLLI